MSRALGKVIVVDLTTEFWASLAAATLGDFGAEVVRIDALLGTQERRANNADDHVPGSWNYRSDLANRNKMSLALNLDKEGGLKILHQLVRRADVVVTDQPLSLLKQKGLD